MSPAHMFPSCLLQCPVPTEFTAQMFPLSSHRSPLSAISTVTNTYISQDTVSRRLTTILISINYYLQHNKILLLPEPFSASRQMTGFIPEFTRGLTSGWGVKISETRSVVLTKLDWLTDQLLELKFATKNCGRLSCLSFKASSNCLSDLLIPWSITAFYVCSTLYRYSDLLSYQHLYSWQVFWEVL